MIYINRDITTLKSGILINGVNCQNKMNSGIAKCYSDKWSEVKTMYHMIPNNKMILGTIQLVKILDPELDGQVYVANCFTQKYYGRNIGYRYANPNAIKTCFEKVWKIALEYKLDIFTPYVGCGLGGLNWSIDVEPVIREVEKPLEGQRIIVCSH